MRVEANAKINLTLDVVCRRKDGYHELDMIMLPLEIHDVLEVSLASEDCIRCEALNFPLHESNTIYKAIQLMRKQFSLTQHFHVKVEKNIPMQAGLAGGSADAAAMLKAIVSLCNLQVSESQMVSIAKQIGADVPFCYYNRAARVKGIGEQLQCIEGKDSFHILLVKDEAGVSTKEAFEGIDFTTCKHPNVEECASAFIMGDYKKMCNSAGNTLEDSSFVITPIIATIKKQLQQDGFDCVLMSGSGSTVFALTKDKKLAQEMQKKYAKMYAYCVLTKSKSHQ